MEKNKPYLYSVIIGALFIIALLFLMERGAENKRNKNSKEFPDISIDSTIVGVVKDSYEYVGSIPKGALHITLTNGLKMSGTSDARIVDLEKGRIRLGYFLESGDSICKPAGKDSLYVFRNGKKYVFYNAGKERIDQIMGR